MTEWRTLVVDGDREAAARHCRLITRQPGLVVVGASTSAAQAIELVMTLQPQLLMLDVELADGDGLRLLRRLRATGRALEVIVTTAQREPEVVRAALQLGVVDYVLKPFYPARLRRSLGLLARRRAIDTYPGISQPAIDASIGGGPSPSGWLPRDLRPHRLEEVRSALSAAARPVTAEQIAVGVGIARTTARRYLEYLVTIEEARVSSVATGPGRPFKCYEHHDAVPIGSAPERPGVLRAAAGPAAHL